MTFHRDSSLEANLTKREFILMRLSFGPSPEGTAKAGLLARPVRSLLPVEILVQRNEGILIR